VFQSVIVRASDPDASRGFYGTVLAAICVGPDGWREFELEPVGATNQRPTRGLHIAFVTRSREQVDAFWKAGVEAGYPSDGEPGPRPIYSSDYYGAFLLDPDGNSVEAVYLGFGREGPAVIDHLWVRVADLEPARRFWTEAAEKLALTMYGERPERFHLRDGSRSFAIVHDERPVTENLELVFPVSPTGEQLDISLPDGNRIRTAHPT
jgi:catechol 2,3-dioxygenase-like lactoylglutathione lyase family enzyme